MPLKPITSEQYTALEEAHMMLLRARAIFRDAGALRTLKRVELAVSSSKGAIRHAQNRATACGAGLIVHLNESETDRMLRRMLTAVTDAADAGATVKACFEVLMEGFENVGYPLAASAAELMAKAFEGRDA